MYQNKNLFVPPIGDAINRNLRNEPNAGLYCRSHGLEPAPTKLLIGLKVGSLGPFVPCVDEYNPLTAPIALVPNCTAQPASEIGRCRAVEGVGVLSAARCVVPTGHY